MKISSKIIPTLAATLLTCAPVASIASTLLYISPSEYQYSAHLSHPYDSYWFEQGPLVEPIAFEALKDLDPNVAMCTANETADTIIHITPRVFYNPTLRIYYGTLIADVYTGAGDFAGTFSGEAQQLGVSYDFSIGTEDSLKQVYTLAMQDLMGKLEINSAETIPREKQIPCGMMERNTKPRFYLY